MEKILLIENDATVQKSRKDRIEKELHLFVITCKTLTEALEVLKSEEFLVILTSLKLPDASALKVVDRLADFDVPLIVFSHLDDESLRNEMLEYDLLDYMSESNASSFDYAIRLIQFVHLNKDNSILIVDDSETARMQFRLGLERVPMQILDADSAESALQMFEKHKNIKVAIVDKHMGGMDGVSLIYQLRRTYSFNELSILGVSGSDDHVLTLDFLKSGANDFIHKTVSAEELFTRVVSNVEMLDYIKIAKESSIRDHLTGLPNRTALFEIGDKLFEQARRKDVKFVVAIVEIDHFGRINDRYGHFAGDLALKSISKIMKDSLRNADTIARFSIREFCVFLSNTSLENGSMVMDKLRQKVAEHKIEFKNRTFSATISVGLNNVLGRSLEEMINRAIRAKADETNCVIAITDAKK